jgi:hypothetical protein
MPHQPTAPLPSRPAPRHPGRDRTHPADRREATVNNGNTIGDYEIERTLGNGSFGKVKREFGEREICLLVLLSFFFNGADWVKLRLLLVGRHKLTGHHVAMKFISKRKIATREYVSLSNVFLTFTRDGWLMTLGK